MPDPGYEVKSTPEETREYYANYRSLSEGPGKDGQSQGSIEGSTAR